HDPPAAFFSLTFRPPPSSTLFPCTPPFRSRCFSRRGGGAIGRVARTRPRQTKTTRGSRPCWTTGTTSRSPGRSDPSKSAGSRPRSEEHTSELQSREKLVCRLLLEKKQATPG